MELRGADAIYFAAGMLVFVMLLTGVVLRWAMHLPLRSGRVWPRWIWLLYWVGVAMSVPAVIALLSTASSI